MDSTRPAYLPGKGRGRGRGSARGSNEPIQSNAWNNQNSNIFKAPSSPTKSPKKKSSQAASSSSVLSASARFADAAEKHKEDMLRHLSAGGGDEQYLSGSDNDDDDSDGSGSSGGHNQAGMLENMMKSFTGSLSGAGGDADLSRTREHLINSVRSNACLICIETIRRTEAIWSCCGCYASFHIACIQKWVKDGVYQQTALSDEHFPAKEMPWQCPKCRHEYPQSERPARYVCYCGKEEDPAPDPWTAPHSCGQMCGKTLKPECGHTCLLLCHPGPCPSCPQTVRSECFCGQAPPQIRRCGNKAWSCGKPCSKPLLCGHHACSSACHRGDCPACPETSPQPCRCQQQVQVRPCAEPDWQCDKVCGLPLTCGQHTCERVCHAPGECGECPRAGKRRCPCGKSTYELPCTEDVSTCQDTCDKTLECGKHPCTQRCHTGPCGTCREMTEKTCRCGKRSREIQCYKEYQCETKCQRTKDCGKHQCKRKCCDGNCPPCDLQCNKPLSCRNHKCASRCHRGPCYPCPLTVDISCQCGETTVTVPCGREKVTKPPRCNALCRAPPDCHHAARDPHRCHSGRCPPCRQTCCKPLAPCGHTCPARCHSAVLMKLTQKVVRSGPWDPAAAVELKLQSLPCPPCQVPTRVTCPGQHETATLPCHDSAVRACGRVCGRVLACGNHTCQLPCHEVTGVSPGSNEAGSSCERCEAACERPRPDGCSHPCLMPCHRDDCPPCEMMIRMRCHCSLVLRHVECDRWTHADDRERDRLKSCSSQCPKHLSCSHQCMQICHPGPCPGPERCVEKVKVRCACKRRKRDFLCNEVSGGFAEVSCDEICEQNKVAKKKEKEEAEKAKKEAEIERQKQELAEYERKMKGKRRKPRKQKQEDDEPTCLQRYGMKVIGPVLVVMLAAFVYYLLNT